MLVCRACCCGTTEKHPDVDHDAHLDRLQLAVNHAPGARLFVVDCLDKCDRSNVVVVRAKRVRHWFGDMLEDDAVNTLAGWLAEGAPSAVPAALAPHVFDGGALPNSATNALS